MFTLGQNLTFLFSVFCFLFSPQSNGTVKIKLRPAWQFEFIHILCKSTKNAVTNNLIHHPTSEIQTSPLRVFYNLIVESHAAL